MNTTMQTDEEQYSVFLSSVQENRLQVYRQWYPKDQSARIKLTGGVGRPEDRITKNNATTNLTKMEGTTIYGRETPIQTGYKDDDRSKVSSNIS